MQAALEDLRTDLQVTQAKVDALSAQMAELLREIRGQRIETGTARPSGLRPRGPETVRAAPEVTPMIMEAPPEAPEPVEAPPVRTSALRRPRRMPTEAREPATRSMEPAPAPVRTREPVPMGPMLPSVATPVPPRAVSRAPLFPEEEVENQFSVYENALNEYHAENYARAREAFSNFLQRYPSSTYANNAQFYIGQCYYAQKKYPDAIEAYRLVVERYPRGGKVPSSMLKLAYAHEQLGLKEEARHLLQQVVDSYPYSSEAQLARNHLASM